MSANSEDSVLVYDVGGSHISSAVCFAGDYRLGPVVRGRYGACETAEAFVDLLQQLGVEAAAGTAGIQGAGLAMPGPFDYAAGISQMRHKLPYLYGVDLRGALAARFDWQPQQVRFLNDAAAYLLGEVGAGAARGVARAVGVTLGTGIGSAFAIDGSIVTSGPGVPPGGEVWNLPYGGGIVEDALSGRAIQNNYQTNTGKQVEVAESAALAPTDAAAAEAFAEFGRHLGIALRMLTAEFAPEAVVIGGGISRSAQLFLPAAEYELEGMKVELRVSSLRDKAALVGAGVAWFASKDN